MQQLPAFARHLRDNFLDEFVAAQIKYAQVLQVPLLDVVQQLPEEKRAAFYQQTTHEYLTQLADNKAAEQIENNLRLWKENMLPEIDKEAITDSDITLVNYLRKQAMLQFAPAYCSSTNQLLQLVQELDFLSMKTESASFSTYLDILGAKIEEQAYLTNKITNTSPGIIYLFNLRPYSVLYANQTAETFFGFSNKDLINMGSSVFEQIIHPDDLPATFHFLREISSAQDSEVRILEFRMRQRNGAFVWMRNYFSVFKRDAAGVPSEIIGNILNIQAEKEATYKLQESEKRYRQAEARTHIGHYDWDLTSGQVLWSEELFRIYGLQPANRPIFLSEIKELTHPDDYHLVQAEIQKALTDKSSFLNHHRICAADGSVKTVQAQGEVVTNADGQPVKMAGTLQDVTSQHRVQQELNENQAFLRRITDATPAAIAAYNVHNGNNTFMSQGLYKLLGYDLQEASKGGFAFIQQHIHPEDLESVREKIDSLLEEANRNPDRNDIVVEATYRIRHSNGSYQWFHTYATVFDRNAEGAVEHVLHIMLDVTGQQEASLKIEEQEQFIQNIADASPTILYVYDVPGGHLAYVNREVYFVLGYTPEEIIDMGATVTGQLYHPEDYALLPERPQSERHIQQSDLMIQYECRLRHKSGEWIWFLVREVVFRTDDEDRPMQIVGAALDISKRKDMEKTLLQNSFMLEQSNASLEEFAYVASHDLKEPLRKISTFGDRLAATQAEQLSPEGKMFLSKIIDASQRMQTMISDLLSISMISGNRSYEQYSLQKVLTDTLQTLEFKIEQKNAQVLSDGLPEASIVVSQFRQLFQNLISNSLKFVADGVQPQIRITHSYLAPEDVAAFQLAPAPSYLKIELSDNGIGFEKENAGKIFLLFQRLHGRSEYEGSGIGLAICKKIVEHHGGVIYAQGELGTGAVFTIILPAHQPAAG
ncbi:PAS domain-containing sensor histidine kinase [Pseudocnuella soli]|uniref:PAS domain-containing sensor histidine kinase n=1 Tax=Pseudocnuella soli TaxID=2502779 RepID=UPI00104A1693|nr:PAS domain-containing sensor histidine kinase [Pseudocnuella soli]